MCDSSPCINAGICEEQVGGYVCNCKETNYQGPICESIIDNCLFVSCLNDGLCKNGICDCDGTGYQGDSCQFEILECLSSGYDDILS